MRFPIYINNRDRLTMIKQLAGQCSKLQDVGDIIIVDNASSYEPLLEWYESCPFEVIRLEENRGPRAPWTIPMQQTYYVVTDSDLDIGGCPLHVLNILQDGLLRYEEIIKVGLSLEIFGIPDEYPYKKDVLARESRMWETYFSNKHQNDRRFCIADVDTTFAMYRPTTGWIGYNPALRTNRPYTAKHLPWHQTQEDEEEVYYLKHLSTEGIFWSALANEKYR